MPGYYIPETPGIMRNEWAGAEIKDERILKPWTSLIRWQISVTGLNYRNGVIYLDGNQ